MLVAGQDTIVLQEELLTCLSSVCNDVAQLLIVLKSRLDGSALAVRNIVLSLVRAVLSLRHAGADDSAPFAGDDARAMACFELLQAVNTLVEKVLANIESAVALAQHGMPTAPRVATRALRFNAIDVRVSDVFACANVDAAAWSPDATVIGLFQSLKTCSVDLFFKFLCM